MATPLLVLIILAIVIIASIITSVVTYVILSGRNKRIRLAEQYRQLGITEQHSQMTSGSSSAERTERHLKSFWNTGTSSVRIPNGNV